MGLDLLDSGKMQLTTTATGNAVNNAPSVANIAQTIAANQGVINLSQGITYDVYMIPTSLTYQVYSTNATGGVTTTVYGFNNNSLNAAVTNNGSGALSIVNTYGDGFSGKVYEQLCRSANNGKGLLIVGFTVQASVNSSGAASPSAFSTMNLTLISANGYGAAVPVTIDLNQALRNTQYNSGMLTLGYKFYLNSLTQLQMSLPADTKLVFTLFTDASGFTV